MTKLYTAIIAVGEHDDYYEQHVFSSINESMVDDWIERYNSIVGKIEDEIKRNSDLGIDYPNRHNFEYIDFNEPKAIKRESELR